MKQTRIQSGAVLPRSLHCGAQWPSVPALSANLSQLAANLELSSVINVIAFPTLTSSMKPYRNLDWPSIDQTKPYMVRQCPPATLQIYFWRIVSILLFWNKQTHSVLIFALCAISCLRRQAQAAAVPQTWVSKECTSSRTAPWTEDPQDRAVLKLSLSPPLPSVPPKTHIFPLASITDV